MGRIEAARVRDRQQEARAYGSPVDLLDRTGEVQDPDPVEHRGRDRASAQFRSHEACHQGQHTERETEGQRSKTGEPADRERDGADEEGQPEHRLAVGGEIERHPCPGRDRKPQERPPLLPFDRESAGEREIAEMARDPRTTGRDARDDVGERGLAFPQRHGGPPPFVRSAHSC